MSLSKLRRSEHAPESATERGADHDRRLAWSNKRLFAKLKHHLLGKMMTRQLYHEACQIVEDHVTEAALYGIRFPELAVIGLPGVGAIEVVRADLEPRDLQVWAVNLTVKYPKITACEIAEALARHFPNYVAQAIDPSRRRILPPPVERVG